MFGFTSSVTFYAVAAAFNLGAYLIQNNLLGIKFEDVMLVFSVLLFGAQAVGQQLRHTLVSQRCQMLGSTGAGSARTRKPGQETQSCANGARKGLGGEPVISTRARSQRRLY